MIKKISNKSIILFLLTLITGSAFAAVSQDNEKFSEIVENSLVLKSAKSEILLAVNCKALSPQFGAGVWSWSNGGFIVKFPKRTFAFARQEVNLKGIDKCME